MPPIRVTPTNVSQAELRALVALRNQIRLLTRQFDGQCEKVLRKLLDGAIVEPGVHFAEIEETLAGCSRVDRLNIF